MMPQKKYADYVVEFSLCGLFFFNSFSIAGSEIFDALLMIGWAVKRLMSAVTAFKKSGKIRDAIKVFRFIPTPLNSFVYLLMALGFLSFFFSYSYELSFRGFMGKWFCYFLLYFITVENFFDYSPETRPGETGAFLERKFRRFLGFMLFAVTVITFDGPFQQIFGFDYMRGYNLSVGVRGSFMNPNSYAAWMTLFSPFLAVLFCAPDLVIRGENKKWIRYLCGAGLVIQLYLMVLTSARGSWMGLLGALLAMGALSFFSKRSQLRRNGLKIAIGILAAFAAGLLIFPSFRSDVLTISGGFSLNYFRGFTWQEALAIIQDFPLVGIGPNAYSEVAQGYKLFEAGGVYPHNSFLQFAAEFGLPAFMTLSVILLKYFWIGVINFKSKPDVINLGLMAGILAYLIGAFFDVHLFSVQLSVFFWLYLGLGIAVNMRMSAERTSS